MGVAALLAGSVTLPVGAIGLFKLLAFLLAMAVVLWRPAPAGLAPTAIRTWTLRGTRGPVMILLALLALTLSLAWSSADLGQGLQALGKHGKLLAVPVLLLLIRTPAEARLALLGYGAVHVFVLTSSYLVAAGFKPPWVPDVRAAMAASVFSSYLDESIMAACLAAICWHLRHETGWRHGRWMACALALAALVNVLYILPGRTGHVVAIAMCSLALVWSLPRRLQWAAWLAPVLVLGVIALSSAQFRERVSLVAKESRDYAQGGTHRQDVVSSSGLRLDFWRKSLQSMAERPLAGSGVGSWNGEYIRQSDGRPPPMQEGLRNPHQEYLLWGVELGVPGVLLLLGIFGALYRDASALPRATGQALKSLLIAGALACLFNSALFDAQIGDFFCVLWGLLLASGRAQLAPASPAAPPMAGQPVSA